MRSFRLRPAQHREGLAKSVGAGRRHAVLELRLQGGPRRGLRGRLDSHRPRDGPDVGVRVHRLLEVGARAGHDRAAQDVLEVLSAEVVARVRGHDEHGDAAEVPVALQLEEQLLARLARHDEVEGDEVGRARTNPLEGLLAVAGRDHAEPGVLQDHLQVAPNVGLVVDDQNGLVLRPCHPRLLFVRGSGRPRGAAAGGRGGTPAERPTPLPPSTRTRPFRRAAGRSSGS